MVKIMRLMGKFQNISLHKLKVIHVPNCVVRILSQPVCSYFLKRRI